MKKITLLFVLFCPVMVFGQKQGNIWYFGDHAGIDFNPATPVALTNGALKTLEGCASVANSKGELLFYTNGITIWNKNHQPMPNGDGLLGDSSSTQSAVIVPQPLSPSTFYVFTVDAEGRKNGLRYSIVDMSLNSGTGDVTTKNVLLNSPMTEKITAVRGSGGQIWVITHALKSNRFLAYSVSSSGISTFPVVSAVGSLQDNACDAMGYLKASLDGSKLALAVSDCITPTAVDRIELFNFNTKTGEVTDLSPSFRNSIPNAYGIEFSPNGNYLYVSSWYSEGKLYQFDLKATNITASKKIVGSTVPSGAEQNINCFGALQLAADGKIYVAKNQQGSLGVINNPNDATCNFVDNSFDLKGKKSELGLPTFIQSYFSVLDVNAIISGNECLGTLQDTVKFELPLIVNVKSVRWDFGDSTTSNTLATYHFYQNYGSYQVKLHVEYIDGTVVDLEKTVNINKAPLPPKNLLKSYGFCENSPSVEIDATSASPDVTYEWKNSKNQVISTQPKITYATEDTLSIKISLRGCTFEQKVPVAKFKFDLGKDVVLCQGDSAVLAPMPGLPDGTVYSWYFQQKRTDPLTLLSNSSSVVAKKAGIYTLLAGLGKCSWIDDIVISYNDKPLPKVRFVGNTLFCVKASIKAEVTNPTADPVAYEWYYYQLKGSPVSTDQVLITPNPGKYILKLTRSGCFTKDSVIISKPSTSLLSLQYLCTNPTVIDGQAVLFPYPPGGNNTDPSATYTWTKKGDPTFLVTTRTLSVTEIGTYRLESTAFGCSFVDTVRFLPKPLPLTLPRLPAADAIDTSFCANNFPVTLDATDPSDVLYLEWSSNNKIITTNPKVTISVPGDYNLMVRTGCETKNKIFTIHEVSPIFVNLKPVTYACPGPKQLDSRVANARNIGAIYVWTNEKGDTLLTGNEDVASVLNYNSEGVYTVNITNKCFKKTSSTRVVFIKAPVLKTSKLTSLIETCKDVDFNEVPVENAGDDIHYAWTLNGNTVSDSLKITFKKSGIYTLKATNDCGSVSHDVKVIYYDANNSKLPPAYYKCVNESLTIAIASDTVNTFQWTKNGIVLGNTASLEVNETGIYTVVVSNKCGSATFSTEVFDKPAVNADFDPFVQACGTDGTPFSLKVLVIEPEKQGRLHYKWYFNNALFAATDTSFVQANKGGTYKVMVSNDCGSEITRSTDIVYSTPPRVSISGDTLFCPDQTTTLTAKATHADPTATFRYRWDNNPALNTAVLQNARFGTHFVDVVAKSCTQRAYITTSKPVVPLKITLGKDSSFCKDQPYNLVIPANPDYHYKWLRNGTEVSQEASITFTESGRYKLIVSNGCGDSVEEEILIEALPCLKDLPPGECPLLYMYNLFTPNNDGSNDTFLVRCLEGTGWHLTVYNRFGKNVYENKDYDNLWDGGNVATGLYYYTLVSPKTGKLYNGWVEILK